MAGASGCGYSGGNPYPGVLEPAAVNTAVFWAKTLTFSKAGWVSIRGTRYSDIGIMVVMGGYEGASFVVRGTELSIVGQPTQKKLKKAKRKEGIASATFAFSALWYIQPFGS